MSAKSVLLNTPTKTADLARLEGEWRVVAEARGRVPMSWLCMFAGAELSDCTSSWTQTAQVDGALRPTLRKLALRNAAVAVATAKEHLRAARPVFEHLARDPAVGARRWAEALEALDDLPHGWLVIDPAAVLLRPGLADGPALFAAALSNGPDAAQAQRRLALFDADASDDDNFPAVDAGFLEPGRFPRRTRTAAEGAALREQLAGIEAGAAAPGPPAAAATPARPDGREPPARFWDDEAALASGRERAKVVFGSSSFLGTRRFYAAHLANLSTERIRVLKFAAFVKAGDGWVIPDNQGAWATGEQFASLYGVPADGWLAPGASVACGTHVGDDGDAFHAYWCEGESQARFMALAPRPPSRTGGRSRAAGAGAPAACPPAIRGLLEHNAGIARRYARDRHQRDVGFDLDGVRWLDETVESHRGAGPAKDQQGNVALMGAFLGECLLRVFGGRWERHDEEIVCVRVGDATWFPFAKVGRQLADGRAAGESVLGFFQDIGALQGKSASARQQRLVALFKARSDYAFLVARGPAGAREWARVRRIEPPWVFVDDSPPPGPGGAPEAAIALDAVTEFKVRDVDGRDVDPTFAPLAPPQVLSLPAQPEFAAAMTQQRAAFVPPRGAALQAMLGARAAWMKGTQGLAGRVEQQGLLLAEGRIVWGVVVQANVALYMPGEKDYPAQVLHTPDPYYDARPAELSAIARRLYALKGTAPADPVEKMLAARVTNESEDRPAWRLPPEVTAHEVLVSIVMIWRKHLPRGVLSGRCFPMLMHPSTSAVMILPATFWSPEMNRLRGSVN